MKPNIGITLANREGVIEILNMLLADEFVLNTRTRKYHWNVVGSHFAALHALFDRHYVELNEIVDQVAERVRQLGGFPAASLAEFLRLTRLDENSERSLDDMSMIERLCTDHEAIIQRLREDLDVCDRRYSDMGTSNFLTDLMEKHEKMAWMLRAHLEEPEGIAVLPMSRSGEEKKN